MYCPQAGRPARELRLHSGKRGFNLVSTCALAAYRYRTGSVIVNAYVDIHTVVRHGFGKLVAPFDQYDCTAFKQAEKIYINEVIFLIEPVQVKMKQGQFVANIFEQDIECRARHVIIDAKPHGESLGKLSLSST